MRRSHQTEHPVDHKLGHKGLQTRGVELIEKHPLHFLGVILCPVQELLDELEELGPTLAVVEGELVELGLVLEEDLGDVLDQVGLAAAGLAHEDDGLADPGLLNDHQDF